MGEYYSIQSASGSYESKTVVLATGVNFGRPLPGEEELLGKGVSYCATCDAFAVRGRKAIVIGYDKEAEAEADFLSQMAQSVTYIPMYKDEPSVSEKVTVLREMPVEILGAEMDGMTMVLSLIHIYNLDLVTTAPGVIYRVHKKNGDVISLTNPSNLPDPTEIDYMEEPIVSAEIMVTTEFVGAIMNLCQERRGVYLGMEYIETTRALLKYELPLN